MDTKQNNTNNNITWLLNEKFNKELDENEIKSVINKKLAYIIIELENNPILYITKEKNYNY